MNKADLNARMLAEEAKKDENLKTLMKVVADGQASPAQLKEFQEYIHRLEEAKKQEEAALLPTPHPYAQHPAAIPTPNMPSRLLSIPKGAVSAYSSFYHLLIRKYRNPIRNLSLPSSSHRIC